MWALRLPDTALSQNFFHLFKRHLSNVTDDWVTLEICDNHPGVSKRVADVSATGHRAIFVDDDATFDDG